jgi:hypothetical protein
MQQLRDQFFSGAALALQKYGDSGCRYLFDSVTQIAHERGTAKKDG